MELHRKQDLLSGTVALASILVGIQAVGVLASDTYTLARLVPLSEGVLADHRSLEH